MLLTSLAFASPPDRTVRLFEVDPQGGYVERMQLSTDNILLVGRTRTSKVGFLLNTDTFVATAAGPVSYFVGPDKGGCSVSAVTTSPGVVGSTSEDGWNVWTACEDGRLLHHVYFGAGFPTADTEAPEVEVDTRLDGVWYEPTSNLLYALKAGDGVAGSLHIIDPQSLAVDAVTTFPKPLPTNGFAEGVVVQSAGAANLVISHGGSNMSHLLLGTSNTGFLQSGAGGGFGCSDMCAAPAGDVFCVDPNGAIARYQLAGRQFLGLGLALDEPRGVGASLDVSDGWIAVTGNKVFVWEMTDANTVVTANGPYYESESDADNPIQDIVANDGYMYGGGEAGYIHVVTQNPWIYPQFIEISQVVDGVPQPAEKLKRGDQVAIEFLVNQEGDYEVAIGGGRPYSDEGKVVDDGPLVLMDQGILGEVPTGQSEFTVDERFDEGVNFVWLRATGENGDLGHAAASIIVDNPPRTPGVDLGFGDRSLNGSIQGISDSDLDHYDVWISDEPFAPGDFETGGPTGFRPVRRVDAAPGTDPEFAFGNLVNGQTYYVAARAYDTSGAQSDMSAVQSEVPREVLSAADRAGEKGGSPCSTGAAGPSTALALFAALGLAVRRRSALAVAAAVLVLPGVAQAQDEEEHWWRQDTTPTTTNLEIRYGVIDVLDPAIDNTYKTNALNMLQFEVGPQILHVFEVDVGMGFFQELDFQRSEDGQVSDQRTMLTWYPLQLDATFRAQFLDEQPVVPFVRYGWDYVLYSEKTDVAPGGPKDTLRGGKFGTHYALGGNLLLDLVQRGRASFLETRTGINDSWLTFEWRRQRIDGRDRPWSGRDDQLGSAGPRPLDFSGDAFTVGLKLDW